MKVILIIRTSKTKRAFGYDTDEGYTGPIPAPGDSIELGRCVGAGKWTTAEIMANGNKVERFTVGERWFEWPSDGVCEVTIYAADRRNDEARPE